MSRSSICRP